ncbi:MAG: PilZ domain-containing protein [Thiogranum sp.]
MDTRTHPRTRVSVSVQLYCARRNSYHNGKTGDISPGGLFVNGSPCGTTGAEFDVFVECPETQDPLRFRAQIARVAPNGFGLQFTAVSPGQLELIEGMIRPDWDGRDTFEGLMIFAAREQVVDLADWLRLTSLVCGEYQRRALSQSLAGNGFKDTGR